MVDGHRPGEARPGQGKQFGPFVGIELLRIEEGGLLHHTLVVGQSGSGKSFMVARLLEEVLLRTSARLIILDPNGDFRDVNAASESAWSEPVLRERLAAANSAWEDFASEVTRGQPSYDQRDEFVSAWNSLLFAYLSSRREAPRGPQAFAGPFYRGL